MICVLRLLSICGLVLVLTGCVPVVATYYDPQGVGSVRYQGPCSVDIRKQLIISVSNTVEVSISAFRKDAEPSAYAVFVEFNILPGTTAKAEQPYLAIQYKGDMQVHELVIQELQDSMYGGLVTDTNTKGNARTSFGFHFELENQNAEEFSVVFPTMIINEVRTTVSPVTFVRKKSLHGVGLCQ